MAGCTPATWASGWTARHVRIVDRLKDIMITAGGKNVSPSEIENSLKFSPYVKEAVVVGDGRPYLTALVGIELETVGRLGPAQPDPLHHLPRPLREARGAAAGAGRDPGDQRALLAAPSRSRSSA